MRLASGLMTAAGDHWRSLLTSLGGEILHVQLSPAGRNSYARWDCEGTMVHWPNEDSCSGYQNMASQYKCQCRLAKPIWPRFHYRGTSNKHQCYVVSVWDKSNNKKNSLSDLFLLLIIKSATWTQTSDHYVQTGRQFNTLRNNETISLEQQKSTGNSSEHA